MNEVDIQILTYVDADTKARFQQVAKGHDRSLAAELRQAIKHWIHNHQGMWRDDESGAESADTPEQVG